MCHPSARIAATLCSASHVETRCLLDRIVVADELPILATDRPGVEAPKLRSSEAPVRSPCCGWVDARDSEPATEPQRDEHQPQREAHSDQAGADPSLVPRQQWAPWTYDVEQGRVYERGHGDDARGRPEH